MILGQEMQKLSWRFGDLPCSLYLFYSELFALQPGISRRSVENYKKLATDKQKMNRQTHSVVYRFALSTKNVT